MFADHLTGIADILLSVAEDGEIRVNIGEETDGTGFASEMALWCPDGFFGMPNDPDADGACQVVFLRDGQQKRGIASRDGRFHSKAGKPKQGDRWIVSNCDARFMLRRATNQLVLYTANDTDDGHSMLVELNGSTGEFKAVVSGASIIMTKDSIQLSAGGTVIDIDATGMTVNGAYCALNTGGGNLGTVGPLAPTPVAMAVLGGPVGMAGSPSPKWTVALA